MKNFDFFFPVNKGKKPLGELHVSAVYHKGEAWYTLIKWGHIDMTEFIEVYAEGLDTQIQEATENQAADLGFKVRHEDPRETELSQILKP